MKPLICFYKNQTYLYSTDYACLSCPEDTTVDAFLQSIEIEYAQQLKVIQVNYEYDHQLYKKNPKPGLYRGAKAHAFIIHQFDQLTIDQLSLWLKKYNDSVHNDSNILTHPTFKPLIEKQEFLNQVDLIKKDIALGRLYQANLTAPLIAHCSESAEIIFEHYLRHFTGEYKALLPCHEFSILSYSPELFLEKNGHTLITRPIKGSISSEKNFTQDLYKNQKEAAELSMIVDLLRNDLNSLSIDHSADVTAHREPMNLGYIQHTYSEIKVQSEKSLPHTLRHTLPGGSISGCPKLESLQVIHEIEKYQRQFYTGIIGWWQENDFRLSLTIRSFLKFNHTLIYHAGCGIVHESSPKSEWQEFLIKTGGLCDLY